MMQDESVRISKGPDATYRSLAAKLWFKHVVVLGLLALLQPAMAVKLHFTKNEGNGKVVYSVADAKVDLPPPPEGTILIGVLSSCHNALRRVNIRSTWANFPGTSCAVYRFVYVIVCFNVSLLLRRQHDGLF